MRKLFLAPHPQSALTWLLPYGRNPRPLVRVGKRGDVGSVEIQDLLFTSKRPSPGAVFVEWNIKASSPGAAAMWGRPFGFLNGRDDLLTPETDRHVRLGGAEGTELTSKQCPPSTSGTNSGCSVGSLMMHITPGSSALLDNVWLWLADHDIDDPSWEDGNNNMVKSLAANPRLPPSSNFTLSASPALRRRQQKKS